jgi:hypothetical protein
MAHETKGPHVVEVAFPAALGNRHFVISVPQRSALFWPQPPLRPGLDTTRSSGSAQTKKLRLAIDPAQGAHAVVPSEYLLSKIPGVAPKLPLMHAPFRAEREAPGRHFQIAPAAESAPVFSRAKGRGVDAASWHRSTRLHENILAIFRFGDRSCPMPLRFLANGKVRAGLWGRLSTCGGLATRPEAPENGHGRRRLTTGARSGIGRFRQRVTGPDTSATGR